MWWYLLFLLRVIRLFIKAHDLFPLIAGLLFSRDMEKRLIHDEHIRCKSMTPKTIYFYFVLYSPFYCEDLLSQINILRSRDQNSPHLKRKMSSGHHVLYVCQV